MDRNFIFQFFEWMDSNFFERLQQGNRSPTFLRQVQLLQAEEMQVFTFPSCFHINSGISGSISGQLIMWRNNSLQIIEVYRNWMVFFTEFILLAPGFQRPIDRNQIWTRLEDIISLNLLKESQLMIIKWNTTINPCPIELLQREQLTRDSSQLWTSGIVSFIKDWVQIPARDSGQTYLL